MTKPSAAFFVTALLISPVSGKLNPTSLTGTWRVTQMKTTGPDGRILNRPQPGLIIFTGEYYSRLIIYTEQRRTGLQDENKSSAPQLLAVWGPFTASSGTYEVSGSTLTCHPLVAKNPQVMAAGRDSVYLFKLEGNTLTTTDVRNSEGPVAKPTTITYTRIE
jgi:hypothetical protein